MRSTSTLLGAALLILLVGCGRRDKPKHDVGAASASEVTAPAAGPELIDLTNAGGSLDVQLAKAKANAKNPLLMVQTTASWCPPCIALKKYMGDPKMQAALKGVTLVRVDIDVFSEAEMRKAGLAVRSVPWFVKMDANLRPADAIASDEWGDDVPANMAPVLASFAKGTFTRRKRAWNPQDWR